MTSRLRLVPIDARDATQRRELEELFRHSPHYFGTCEGRPAGAPDVEASLSARPPGVGPEDKFFYGIYVTQNRTDPTCHQII